MSRPTNKPRHWKSMLTHQGWFNLLYMQPLPVSHTTEFVICISIYIRLRAVTLLPPPRSLVPRLGLGNTWVRQLRSGSCHYPTAATKCNVSRPANKPRHWKSMLTHQGWFNLLYMQPLPVSHTTEFVICISIYIRLRAVTVLFVLFD